MWVKSVQIYNSLLTRVKCLEIMFYSENLWYDAMFFQENISKGVHFIQGLTIMEVEVHVPRTWISIEKASHPHFFRCYFCWLDLTMQYQFFTQSLVLTIVIVAMIIECWKIWLKFDDLKCVIIIAIQVEAFELRKVT